LRNIALDEYNNYRAWSPYSLQNSSSGMNGNPLRRNEIVDAVINNITTVRLNSTGIWSTPQQPVANTRGVYNTQENRDLLHHHKDKIIVLQNHHRGLLVLIKYLQVIYQINYS
jgi:hypothetical protein